MSKAVVFDLERKYKPRGKYQPREKKPTVADGQLSMFEEV